MGLFYAKTGKRRRLSGFMSIEVFNQLHRDVVNYLIAVYEGKEPPETLRDYMLAFEGGFEPGMKFMLYTPVVNKLIMYVYEKDCDDNASPRHEFTWRCKGIVRTLVNIADFLIYLQEERYISGEYRGYKAIPVPKDFKKHWRRFEEFYRSESEPILFIKELDIIPSKKLFSLQDTFHGGELTRNRA
jgi:hypothetical protein